jgi:asparagine synthase (glutamine-hydrolysing)
VNEDDFLTMERMVDLPKTQFFSFKDSDGFVYGFDAMSFYQLIYVNKILTNPYTRRDFQKETIERVQKLFTADLLRADKSTMAHGLEARVPFLDKEFLELAIKIKPEEKMPQTYQGVEKYILRKAFDTPEQPYLPDEVLWRQKEQFSDGVGYNWIDTLIDFCASQVSDEEFEKATELFPYNTPATKEAFYYRSIFHKHYPQTAAAQTVRKWIPKWQENLDPSGRANAAHVKADTKIASLKVDLPV